MMMTMMMLDSLQIRLSNGKIFEGIFSTFSPQLEVVLELVHTVDPERPDVIDVKTVSREVVFGPQLIVTMSSKDVEVPLSLPIGCRLCWSCGFRRDNSFLIGRRQLDYARKDSFATDAFISQRFNGQSGEKELEPWEADEDECHISLDDAVRPHSCCSWNTSSSNGFHYALLEKPLPIPTWLLGANEKT